MCVCPLEEAPAPPVQENRRVKGGDQRGHAGRKGETAASPRADANHTWVEENVARRTFRQPSPAPGATMKKTKKHHGKPSAG